MPVREVRSGTGFEERLDSVGLSALWRRVEGATPVRQACLDVCAVLDQDRDPSGVSGTRYGMQFDPEEERPCLVALDALSGRAGRVVFEVAHDGLCSVSGISSMVGLPGL